VGHTAKEDQAKKEDNPSCNLDDSKDRTKDKIRSNIKGKAVDSKHINVKVLKSMMLSKHHRNVANACSLILQEQKKKALKALTNKRPVCTTKSFLKRSCNDDLCLLGREKGTSSRAFNKLN
jgi:hypothetical protein